MISNYNILRWDVVKTSKYSLSPALYIRPDLRLMKLIQESGFRIPIKIVDTDYLYDDKVRMATCQPSELTAGYRPNFQKETNTIVLIPDIKWGGYPPKMGTVWILYDQ
jgi:hypothetical protein